MPNIRMSDAEENVFIEEENIKNIKERYESLTGEDQKIFLQDFLPLCIQALEMLEKSRLYNKIRFRIKKEYVQWVEEMKTL